MGYLPQFIGNNYPSSWYERVKTLTSAYIDDKGPVLGLAPTVMAGFEARNHREGFGGDNRPAPGRAASGALTFQPTLSAINLFAPTAAERMISTVDLAATGAGGCVSGA
jgi:hypothetical protein